MLEDIISYDDENFVFRSILFGIVSSTIALFTADYLMPEDASILTIAFISIMGVVALREYILDDIRVKAQKSDFLSRYERPIIVYLGFFVGIIISLSLWYTMLPQDMTNRIFENQQTELALISSATGKFLSQDTFWMIVTNNLRVMGLMFVLSFAFGSGSVFLVSWNASVIATFVGSNMVQNTSQLVNLGPFGEYASLIIAFLEAITSIAGHGLFEILAYLVAAIAGISLSFVLEGQVKQPTEETIRDFAVFAITAITFLIIGAAIEAGF